jgi:hypothetical protein
MLGVKLKEPPSRSELDGGIPPYRYLLEEEGELEPLLRISSKRGAEADRAWTSISGEDPLQQENASFRDARLALRDEPFVAGGEHLAIQELVRLFRERAAAGSAGQYTGQSAHPGRYANGPYYRDYLAFFRSLASASGAEFTI